MKAKIHPTYYDDCQASCACGNSFVTGSTVKEIKVEICSACHPFYTGQTKYIDTEGRIDKFERERKAAAVNVKIGKKKKRRAKNKTKIKKLQTKKALASKKTKKVKKAEKKA